MAASILLPLFFLALAISTSTAIVGRPRPNSPPKPNAQLSALPPKKFPILQYGIQLSWSPRLAVDASRYTRHQRDRLNGSFASLDAIPYDMSQLLTRYPATPADVVATFISDKRYYDYRSNTFTLGQRCGTYTQVVWRKTAELGYAQSVCRKGDNITICFYYP